MSVCVGLGRQFGRGESVCLEHESDAVQHIQNTAVEWSIFSHFLELSAVFNTRAVEDDVVSKWGACRGQIWPAGPIFPCSLQAVHGGAPAGEVCGCSDQLVRQDEPQEAQGRDQCCTPALPTQSWQPLAMAFVAAHTRSWLEMLSLCAWEWHQN